MSDGTDRSAASTGSGPESRTEAEAESNSGSILEGVLDRYHVPLLAGVMAFMFWVRIQAYERFVTAEGIAFSGVDPWYQWRTVVYTVRNWPWTMPYEVWTGYPTGTYVGQFGTFYDQIVATVVLLVGLGDPSRETVFQVAILLPPAFATLCAIPTYYIGKRLSSRIGGLIGVGLLALFPGTFLRRSTVSMLQHHAAEVLFMSLAVLAMMVALRVGEGEKPVYEQFITHDFSGLKRPLGYSALAGIALALYIWIWPPGVVLIGIIGVFFAISLAVDYLRGVSPDHTAVVGAVAFAVTGVFTALHIQRWTASATSFGYLQPALAFGVAAGCVFMAWLARVWDARGFERWGYPVTVLGLIILLAGVVAVVLPDLFGTVATNVRQRLLFGQGEATLTIVEAQPPENPLGQAVSEYGLAFFTGALGLGALVVRPFVGKEYRAEYLLVVVWALFVTSMAFTQVRFNYYLAVVVAVCNAVLIGAIIDWTDLAGGIDSVRSLGGYQILTIGAVVLLLFVPLLSPIAGPTAVAVGAAAAPSGDALKWEESNEWLANNTPEEGQYGGANNSLAYYGTYHAEDGDFAYPNGSYGVMSWWDYGHLITVQGERIPHANPFQQNADSAAAFFTADSERRAELIMEALPAATNGSDLNELSNEELAALADSRTPQEASEEMRYVMIDDEMAGAKFSAIATWAGSGQGPYVGSQQIRTSDNGTALVPAMNDAYRDTTLSRLYHDDASGMEHYRLVHESPRTSQFVSIAYRTDNGGGWQPLVINRKVTPAIQSQVVQLQRNPNVDIQVYNGRQESAVKTYERVEGGQLVGQAQPGATVTASLNLTAESSGRTFTYTQQTTADEDGTFSMTVPYPTTDDLGPAAGYTDASVTAQGEYEITTGGTNATTTVSVSEEAIHNGTRIRIGRGG